MRTTGLVESGASVIAERANLFAEVKRQLYSVQGHTKFADNALHCHKSCRKLKYEKTNRINGSFLFALVRTTGLVASKTSVIVQAARQYYCRAARQLRAGAHGVCRQCTALSQVLLQTKDMKKRTELTVRFCLFWCGQQDLNLHSLATIRT